MICLYDGFLLVLYLRDGVVIVMSSKNYWLFPDIFSIILGGLIHLYAKGVKAGKDMVSVLLVYA